MCEIDESFRRVRFFGANDLATGRFVQRAANLAEQFDPNNPPTSTIDVLEFHNVQQYLEHSFFPADYSEEQCALAKERIPQIRSTVARFFSVIDNTNVETVIHDMTENGHGYHGDLLELLGRNKVYDRCAATTVLPALSAAGVHIGEILGCKKLINSYDAEVRTELLASPRNAEHVIRKYLQEDICDEIYLPQSFTPEDSRELLTQYIDEKAPNPNYVRMIASSEETPEAGVNVRLKLRAKRRIEELDAQFFKDNGGIRTGCTITITDQEEPVTENLDKSDGLICCYTYSRHWLESTCDNPSILNNFIHLFEFVDRNSILTLPSYPASLSVMERISGTQGKKEYRTGTVFQINDTLSLQQTRIYHSFLESRGINLEQVISWFFEEYLVKEFQAENFSFIPSSVESPYLQKSRHLFAEMESIVSQFSIFDNDGELDRDLLSMGSKQVRYKKIPSLLEGKYLYPTTNDEIKSILNLLFSDQSYVKYISEQLQADSGAMLLLNNKVSYHDFHDYQKPLIDLLINLGIIENDGTRVKLVNVDQFQILSAFFNTQCTNYFHLSDHGKVVADAMVSKGWAERRSSLLSEDEGRYFNYFLNAAEFSNGPQLRNNYQHGSQASAEEEETHLCTYMIALRLTVALVIKMNDEFCLAAEKNA